MVTIIIPAYNAEQSIGGCLDALLAQTCTEFHVIVVDDGSRDRTAEICGEYAARDERIEIRSIPNGGVSHARNTGLELVKEGYVMFIDSDDAVTPDYVQAHVQAMETEHTDWVISGYTCCFPDRREENPIPDALTGTFEKERYGEIFTPLYDQYFINAPWNKLYKRELITSGFPEDMSLGEDLTFNLAYFRNTAQLTCIPGCYYDYRIDAESLGHKAKKENLGYLKRNYEDLMKLCREYDLQHAELIRKKYKSSVRAQNRGLLKQALLRR